MASVDPALFPPGATLHPRLRAATDREAGSREAPKAKPAKPGTSAADADFVARFFSPETGPRAGENIPI